jgi:hypothetical protein
MGDMTALREPPKGVTFEDVWAIASGNGAAYTGNRADA